MAATIEEYRSAMLPKYLEIMDSAIEDYGSMDSDFARRHTHHLRIARQVVENGTLAWWEQYRDEMDHMGSAMRQTWSLAQCLDSCGASPRNRI